MIDLNYCYYYWDMNQKNRIKHKNTFSCCVYIYYDNTKWIITTSVNEGLGARKLWGALVCFYSVLPLLLFFPGRGWAFLFMDIGLFKQYSYLLGLPYSYAGYMYSYGPLFWALLTIHSLGLINFSEQKWLNLSFILIGKQLTYLILSKTGEYWIC